MSNQKILDTFLEHKGLFEDVFGKNTDKIILDREREKAKWILQNVYGYDNVELFFPKEIDEQRLFKVHETMFRFQWTNQEIQQNTWLIPK